MKSLRRIATCAGLLAAAMAVPTPASATVVVFGPDSCGGPNTCADFSVISQGFGDTADVDLSYRSASAPGNSATVATRPWRYSDGGLSGGNGAFVLPNGGTPNQVAEVRFDLLSTGTITLNSVDFGTYLGSADTLSYYLYDTSWSLLTSGSVLLDPLGLTNVAFNLSSTVGLILQFGEASVGGGIQNISYSFDVPPAPPPPPAVPEPASWAMLLVGFSMVGSARRHRARRALA